MSLKIYTNNHHRLFKYYNELTDEHKKTVQSDYEWLDEDSRFYGWIVYRGVLYHERDFISINHPLWGYPYDHPDSILSKWEGYISDSAFSGILIRYSGDNDHYGENASESCDGFETCYQIATYIS